MTLISTTLILIEFIVLPLVATIFGATLYFFIKSRKSLQETLRATRKVSAMERKKESAVTSKRSKLAELEEQFARLRKEIFSSKEGKTELSVKKLSAHKDERTTQDLKSTIVQQQKMLDSYLQKVEELENEGRDELNGRIEDLEKRVDELLGVIKDKDEEIRDLDQQVTAGEKMTAKIDEVYQEFEQLQIKMASLEKQAGRANNLAIELQDARYSYEQVHKELQRKQDKMEEVISENQHLRYQINEVEDKLSDANLQRQQLQKKVQFLTELNNDMQGIADTNKKLQTELRRIGELESMLNMMAEERDFLLRKKIDK